MVESDYEKYKKIMNDPSEIDNAIELLRSALSIGQGTDNELADMLIKRGNITDIEKSVALCKSGMSRGNSWSQMRLARYYRDGMGVPKNLDKAIDLMKKPAEDRIKAAVVDLESMLIQRGTESDLADLFRLYQIGAYEGDVWCQIKAARCYVEGRGVSKDIMMAKILYKLASKSNDVARHELVMLQKGKSSNVD